MNKPTMNRRDFIRQTACAALGVTALVNTISYLQLTSAALAQNDGGADDYKALVCIFLAGGNDSNNMLIPTDGLAGADYLAARPTLGLQENLNNLTLPSTSAFDKYYAGSASSMAVHPSMPEVAELFNAQELAFICNVGTLAAPIPTRTDYLQERVPLPMDLFAHPEQQMQWQTSVSDQSYTTGWGGRTADLLHAAYKGPEYLVSMNISMNGLNVFQTGNNVEVTDVSALTDDVGNFLDGYANFTESRLYGRAYQGTTKYPDPIYLNTPEGERLRTLDLLLGLSRDNLMEQELTAKIKKARILNESGILGTAVDTALASGVDFNETFTTADSRLGDELNTVAKLIVGRSALSNKRQIFFIRVGGYDTHSGQLESHSSLMQELSQGIKAFHDVMVEAGDWDKTVLFTASDFNRTMGGNDDGTDHAWAGHAMVAGGPVAGGDLYGHFPSLKLGEHPDSIDAHRTRGRWIPSVSVDQYASVLSRWFGADSNSMETIFPNLGRFNDPLTTTEPNLGFIPGIMNL